MSIPYYFSSRSRHQALLHRAPDLQNLRVMTTYSSSSGEAACGKLRQWRDVETDSRHRLGPPLHRVIHETLLVETSVVVRCFASWFCKTKPASGTGKAEPPRKAETYFVADGLCRYYPSLCELNIDCQEASIRSSAALAQQPRAHSHR